MESLLHNLYYKIKYINKTLNINSFIVHTIFKCIKEQNYTLLLINYSAFLHKANSFELILV